MKRLAPSVLDARIAEGRALTVWRESTGRTQRELAGLLRISHVTVSRWERGEVGIPDRHRLALAVLGFNAQESRCSA